MNSIAFIDAHGGYTLERGGKDYVLWPTAAMKRSIQTPINVPLMGLAMGLAIALTATLDKIAKSVILDFNFLNFVDIK